MSSDDLNDPELRAAIAASLQETNNDGGSGHNGYQHEVVDLTADSDNEVTAIFPKSNSVIGSETDGDETDPNLEDEDEDLKKAIELSMQSAVQGESGSISHHSSPAKAKDLPTQVNDESKLIANPLLSSGESSANGQDPPKAPGILGLDRKQMEQERLARLKKRKAEEPSLSDQPETKLSRHEVASVPQVKHEASSPVSMTSIHKKSASLATPTQQVQQTPSPSPTPSVQFPEGVVKKTWAFGCQRQGDDIKIEETLQKSDLHLAVLSSFMWDMEWLFSKLDTTKTRFILVMQAKDEPTKRQYECETADMRNLRLCFPPMDGQVNCMHSKLMLLFHSTYLRIVVPTANLTPYDWGEIGGTMENSVFIIDLPKKADPASEITKTAFYNELTYFLRATTLHANVISKLDNYDFSKTGNIAFVHTIGGSHIGDSWRRTGYCGLGRSVESLGLRVSKPINIDFITSSVGSLTGEFLRSIYLASQGDDGMTEYVLRTAKSFPAQIRNDPTRLVEKTTAEEWKNRFRVYFPSEATVRDSKGGPQCAGTICFQQKWYMSPKFPRQVLRDCKSQRPGVLMHNKILYMRPDEPIALSHDTKCQAWAYIGSANLSESAWGRLVQDRSTKEPKLNCRNWECGVLVPVISKGEMFAGRNNSDPELADMLDVFKGTVPVPMRLPAQEYGPNRKPWYFTA
ncbi:tyrosyl-DNA phosphodiesterase-domain-containing protein [Aspergillus avenaceus]|uniref:Tyrosyl-DNA phosphodiesterase-domain-containing protein n=1 Tax=Aspergillus avenaceus TaxID=36643 RepID=A0A5N6TNW2_ASPAV|nr:tyrosyl-DNA phosphodiesterase-domain-containing protein [Aspergillus avenaceus]